MRANHTHSHAQHESLTHQRPTQSTRKSLAVVLASVKTATTPAAKPVHGAKSTARGCCPEPPCRLRAGCTAVSNRQLIRPTRNHHHHHNSSGLWQAARGTARSQEGSSYDQTASTTPRHSMLLSTTTRTAGDHPNHRHAQQPSDGCDQQSTATLCPASTWHSHSPLL